MRVSDLHRLRPVDELGSGLRDHYVELAQIGMDDAQIQSPAHLIQDHIQAVLRIRERDLVELGAVDELHGQSMPADTNRPRNGDLRVELFHHLVLMSGGKSSGIKPGHLGFVREVISQAAHVLEAGPTLAVELDGQGNLTQCPVNNGLFAYTDFVADAVYAITLHEIRKCQKIISIEIYLVAQVVKRLPHH